MKWLKARQPRFVCHHLVGKLMTLVQVSPDESTKSEPKFLEETEKVTGKPQLSTFQAETAKLLEIVAKSLYTDKEVKTQAKDRFLPN